MMKPLAISKQRLVIWLIVTGCGWMLWMVGPFPLDKLAPAIIGLAPWIILTTEVKAEPFKPWHLLLFLLPVGRVIVVFGLFYWLPQVSAEAALRFFKHPGLIIPLWGLSWWVVCRRWWLSRTQGRLSNGTE